MGLCRYNLSAKCKEVDCDDCNNHPMYLKGREDALEEVREYFKSFNPTGLYIDTETWNLGVDNTINRMVKEQK